MACRHRFVPVVLDVELGRFRRVMSGVMGVPVRRVSVVSRRLVIAGFVVPGGFAMVVCRLLVVLCCLMMMARCLFGHGCLLIVAEFPERA